MRGDQTKDGQYVTGHFPYSKTWNKVVYGWDLMQIGQTLIVVPDLNHWLMVENDPEKLKTAFDMQKFADQVAAKG